MNTIKKFLSVFLNAVPIFLMVGLIPFVPDDYNLLLFYALIIIAAFFVKKEKNDLLFFGLGFFVMLASEYLFISTGVEAFSRKSFFGVMPIWLPILWAYAFVAVRRAIDIIDGR